MGLFKRKTQVEVKQKLLSRYLLLLVRIERPDRKDVQKIKEIFSGLNKQQINTILTQPPEWAIKLSEDVGYLLSIAQHAMLTGECPILKAWDRGDFDLVKAMVLGGFNPNTEVDDNKDTLLHLAADGGNLNMCYFLLKAGAENLRTNNNEEIPAVLALIDNNLDALDILISFCAKEDRSKLFNKLTRCKEFEKGSSVLLKQFLGYGMCLKGNGIKAILEALMSIKSAESVKNGIQLLQQHGMKTPSEEKYKTFVQSHQSTECHSANKGRLKRFLCNMKSKITEKIEHFTDSFDRHIENIGEDRFLRDAASTIEKTIGVNWKDLLRELRFIENYTEQEALIEEIGEHYKSFKDQARQCMNEYYKSKGNSASYEDIRQALEGINRKDIADKLRF